MSRAGVVDWTRRTLLKRSDHTSYLEALLWNLGEGGGAWKESFLMKAKRG